MSEIAIITSIKDSLISMDEFSSATVVVNDNSVLDGGGSAIAGKVYAIIYTSDDFRSTQETITEEMEWSIPVMIVVAFDDWKSSLDAFITIRQAVLDEFNSKSEANRVSDGTYISEIRSETPVEGIFDAFTDFSEDSIPDYLAQRLIFATKEF